MELAPGAGPHRDEGVSRAFVEAILRNISTTDSLLAQGRSPGLIGTVSGTEGASRFWQRHLGQARQEMGARDAISLHEDLPVNQALGLLLMWRRMRGSFRPGEGALMAFVFGEGSRAAPFTQAECGQKPAIASFASASAPARRRLSIVELAMRYFTPVEAHLRASGFDGVVVKWGDEVQIPTLPLGGTDARLAGADVVRFVSMRAITSDDARNKDWVGVDRHGRITAFIPRRPLEQMEKLAERGLIRREGGRLLGGVNLGSIAISRALLDALLEEFEGEVMDPAADRRDRPDLDPQLFTALTVAAIEDANARELAWRECKDEAAAMRALDSKMPNIVGRLRRVLDTFAARHGRPARMVAMDFGDQYWGDIGQHRQMGDFYLSLLQRGATGEIARALAGLGGSPDMNGNIIAGDTRLGPRVRARGSVLIDARIESGDIRDSVLVGTRSKMVRARGAFDVGSTAVALRLSERSGCYRVVSDVAVSCAAGERATTVPLEDRTPLLKVHEDEDLRDRARSYDVPILGNPISFADAHAAVTAEDPALLEERREEARARVERLMNGAGS